MLIYSVDHQLSQDANRSKVRPPLTFSEALPRWSQILAASSQLYHSRTPLKFLPSGKKVWTRRSGQDQGQPGLTGDSVHIKKKNKRKKKARKRVKISPCKIEEKKIKISTFLYLFCFPAFWISIHLHFCRFCIHTCLEKVARSHLLILYSLINDTIFINVHHRIPLHSFFPSHKQQLLRAGTHTRGGKKELRSRTSSH